MVKTLSGKLKLLTSRKYLLSVFLLTKLSLENQYRNSYLGVIWLLLQPAFYITVLSIAFTYILRFDMDDGPYSLYLMSGLLSWTLLLSSWAGSAVSLTGRENVFKRCVLPKSMFVIADVLVQTYTFFISFIAIQLVVGIFIAGYIHTTVLFLPLVMIPLIITCFAGGIAISYLAAYLRDVGQLVTMLFNGLFWLTPLVYPFKLVAHVDILGVNPFELNPFFILIRPIQNVVYFGVLPTTTDMINATAVTLVIAVASYFIHHNLRKDVIYYL